MQFDLGRQPPSGHVADRSEILAHQIRLQVQQIREPVVVTILNRSGHRFTKKRSASNIRQKKDSGNRKDTARRKSQVPGDDEQKETKLFVVAFCAFDGDVGGEYSADQKEGIDGEESVQKAAQRKIIENSEDVECVC